LQEKEDYLNTIAQKLDCSPSQIAQKISKLQKQLQITENQLQNIKISILESKLKNLPKKE